MKLLLMQYVKAIKAAANPLVPTIGRADERNQNIVLLRTVDGFPILPEAWNAENYKKKVLETCFTRYVHEHYSGYC